MPCGSHEWISSAWGLVNKRVLWVSWVYCNVLWGSFLALQKFASLNGAPFQQRDASFARIMCACFNVVLAAILSRGAAMSTACNFGEDLLTKSSMVLELSLAWQGGEVGGEVVARSSSCLAGY
jgi:hypothetical protein